MTSGSFRFDRFVLDPGDRQLATEDVPVELNARYFDALALLVGEAGKLVSKNRFLEEVWSGVPVTDEALTQCIKTLRNKLGDDASRPRFIETVPKHGYRFIAPVEWSHSAAGAQERSGSQSAPSPAWRQFLLLGGAGVIGAGVAGILGGLAYGLVGASQPLQSGTGAISVLLVLLSLTFMAALTGGIGVSFGIAASGRLGPWSIIGGAAGGFVVGAAVKLLGLDAFNLLLGRSPGDITGGMEGALLGGAVGLGTWLAHRGAKPCSLRRGVAIAGGAGALGGILISMIGGRLMGGSLDLMARSFAGSRIRIDSIGAMVGEHGFGPVSQSLTAGVEGGLFAACIVGAMIIARGSMSRAA